MSDSDRNNLSNGDVVKTSLPTRYPQGFLGGILMGLANLVPGISGGTMLLAVGAYPVFIRAVAEITTFTFKARSILFLAVVVAGAGLSIVGLAGPVKDLVVEHRWIMYSLFIGLTLGGVPIVWRLIRPMTTSAWVASACGFAIMILLAVLEMRGTSSNADATSHNYAVLFLAGLAGGSAMILPGVSGGYLLLLLGQYVTILAAISTVKDGTAAGDWSVVSEAMHVFVPVGIGVLVGIIGVSNLIRVLLDRFPKPTLGVLLGLLVGAVFGLWPFRGLPEETTLIGEVIKGVKVTSLHQLRDIPKEDWPVVPFAPELSHVLGAIALVAVGFLLSWAISLFGRSKKSASM